jgi:hypothetical protein
MRPRSPEARDAAKSAAAALRREDGVTTAVQHIYRGLTARVQL